MLTITEQDILTAVDEIEAAGLRGFMYQEPRCQGSSRSSSSRSHQAVYLQDLDGNGTFIVLTAVQTADQVLAVDRAQVADVHAAVRVAVVPAAARSKYASCSGQFRPILYKKGRFKTFLWTGIPPKGVNLVTPFTFYLQLKSTVYSDLSVYKPLYIFDLLRIQYIFESRKIHRIKKCRFL